ncbi:septal ring lytic transglycosylase RlpA family protein [Psychroflexus sp. YR1-1]|uniref:Probable endolytic peptidoglycan transglycosylase RlpA n=1 Tax=Psychroflexus aurantiacus TaxID=2709310 RepID=A0A6B3R2K2_9FLAO|nr:septal ring lytic transglycosylase RlpA family protein [Psychroflexus aurantiacus]NEV94278.1 septal ring lytic transglycosylase RlpA family protein [Psychroflexus aurantiacus]
MKTFLLGIFLLAGHIVFTQTQTGKASFYSDKFEGRPTASGEIYKHSLATAAHRTLPFGTKVKVTNLNNYNTAIVKINDRGPFIRGRIIDLSRSVAKSLGILESGVTEVRIEVLAKDTPVSKGRAEYQAPPAENKKKQQTEQMTQVKNSKAEDFESLPKEQEETKDYYELDVSLVKPDYYGVQIASFQESDNLLKLVHKLKASYASEILIQVKSIDKVKVYAIILGQHSTRQEAEDFMTQLQDKYPGAFIVDMLRKD